MSNSQAFCTELSAACPDWGVSLRFSMLFRYVTNPEKYWP